MTSRTAPLETTAARFERRFRVAVILSLVVHGLALVALLLVVAPDQGDQPSIAADLIMEQAPTPPPAPPAPAMPPPQQPQIATQPAVQPAPPAPPQPPQAKPQPDAGARSSLPTFTVRPDDFQRAGVNWLPVYPESARANKLQGQVVITADIGPNGRPTRVVVARSSGHANLDEAARQAVLFWKFRPPQFNGQPVTATIDIPFDFKL